MPFSINRGTNNQIIKKTVVPTATPKISNNTLALQNPNAVALSSLTINGTPIIASGTQLNYLNVTPGTASASKALVTNSSNIISNINSITCSSLNVNGSSITGISSGGGSTQSNSPYLTNVTLGISKGNKAMILDTNVNISNINTLSTNTLTLNSSQLITSTLTQS